MGNRTAKHLNPLSQKESSASPSEASNASAYILRCDGDRGAHASGCKATKSNKFSFNISDTTNSNAKRAPLPIDAACMQRLRMKDGGHFIISDFLSADECSGLVAACEHAGFENLDATFPRTYRQSERVMLFSQRLARSLFARLLPHFRRDDVAGVVPIGFGRSGKWVPVRLNECLKVVKYNPGGKIVPHQDGPWAPFEGQASVYTLVVYLNDDFQGGETVFLPSAEIGLRDMISYKINAKVKPSRGSAVVFDHRFPHAGAQIYSGTKYILRAEVVFQRVFGSELASPTADACLHYTANPKYIAARGLYEESRYHELHGDKEEFVSKYQEVLRMQCEATAEVEAALRANCALRNDTIWVLSMQFLAPNDLLSAMQVDKAMLDVCCRMEIWQPLVLRRWPAAGEHKITLSPLPPAHCVDWRNIYRLRAHHASAFSSLVVYVAPDHLRVASPRDFDISTFCERFVRQHLTNRAFDGLGQYAIAVIPTAVKNMMTSEYLVYSFPVHMNMPDFARFLPVNVLDSGVHIFDAQQSDGFVHEALRAPTDISMSYVLEGGEAVNWPTCAAVVRMFTGLQPSQAVFLISGPEGFVRRGERTKPKHHSDTSTDTSADTDALDAMCYVFPTDEAIFSFQHVLCTPAVRIEHVGVAALAAIGYSYGVVISVIWPLKKIPPNSALMRIYITVVLAGGLVIVNEEVFISPEFVCDEIAKEVRRSLIEFSSHGAHSILNSEVSPLDETPSPPHSTYYGSADAKVIPMVAQVMGFDKIASRDHESDAGALLSCICGGEPGSRSHSDFELDFPFKSEVQRKDDQQSGATKCADLFAWSSARLLNRGVVSSEDIVRGGAVLSTQADHRSKCVFQPFI